MKTKKKLKSSEAAAIEDLNRQLRSAETKGNYKLAAEILNQLGNTYRILGNYEDALEKHKEEVDVCKRHNLKDKMGLGIAYRNIAEVYIDMKEEDKAIPYIKQYLKIAQLQSNAVEEQRALITLARTYLCKAEDNEEESGRKKYLEIAESYLRKAYRLIEDQTLKKQLNDEKELIMMKCNNCQNLGLCLDMQGKHDDSVVWLKKAIDLGRRYRLNEYLQPSSAVLCGIYLKSKAYDEALVAVKEALGAAKSLGNTQMEAESRLLLAKTLFCLNEVDVGKKVLKKLYKQIKVKEALSSFKEEVEGLLTAAIKLCRTLDQICTTDKSESSVLLELYEVAGDNYSILQCFSHAITHYMKAVEFTMKSGITEGKKLSRLYFSIAESFKDQGDYVNAIDNYEKELTLYGDNPLELYKTQTNLAVVMEKAEYPVDEVIRAYKTSIDLAKQTSSKKREASAYQNYGLYLKTIDREDEEKKVMDKVAKIKKENHLTDLEENEDNSQDNLDEDFVDLDNLSDEEESEEEDDYEKKNEVGCKRKKKPSERRNEAGETRLHIAAKKGVLASVKRLIRQGHDVNVRDLAGWTPLHEASNFGHTECISALLQAGAHVNDQGGELCDGIAPLHDALANGHLQASNVLLEHGANVTIKDSKYNYPIDHLIMWRHSQDYDESLYTMYKELKQRLRSLMESNGITYSKRDEAAAARKSKRLRGNEGPVYSFLKPKGNNMDGNEDIIPVRIEGDDFDPDDVDGAKEFYQSAMNDLLRNQRKSNRRRKDRQSDESNSRPISPGPRTALIPEDLDVHEDWMEDDMGIAERKNPYGGGGKRKRNVAEEILSRMDERSHKRRSVSPGPSHGLRRNSERRSRMVVESDNEEEKVMNVGSDSDDTRYDGSPEMFSSENTASSAVEEISRASQDIDLEIIEPELEEDMESFYPSQVPSGRPEVVFGVVNHSQMERERSSSPSSCNGDEDTSDFREQANTKPTRRERNVQSFSSIAKAAKKAIRTQQSKSSFQKSLMSVQTKLRFNKVKHPTSSGSDESPERRGEFALPRVPSSSSITDVPGSRNVNSRSGFSSVVRSEVMRLKVKILDNTLLVPVDSHNMNESVEWLCEQCAQRYLRAYGVKPILTLKTKDGALLSPSDSLSLVLGSGDLELVANVISYDLPPLTERYKSSCSDLGVEVDEDVLPLLNASESSNIFSLRDADLRGAHGKALFQSLQRQHSLTQLSLCGTNLFDEGVKELCKFLPTLPNLITLDLSCNGITENGFQFLVDLFSKCGSSDIPVGLSGLIISHNPLGSRISNGLCEILSNLPNLKSLNVTNCCLTEHLFSTGFVTCLLKTKLDEINVSYNKLGEQGVDKLLRGLNPSRLVALNLSSVGLREGDETFARHFANFLQRNEDCCYLKELYLCDSGLSDTSFRSILMEFNRLVSLEVLDLSNNDLLSIVCLEDILLTCETNHIPLKHLNMSGCTALWEKNTMISPDRILLALESNLQSDRKLSFLQLTTDGPCFFEEDEDAPLTDVETKMRVLWEEYFVHSSCKKDGRIVSFQCE